jgi:hypothetical protein
MAAAHHPNGFNFHRFGLRLFNESKKKPYYVVKVNFDILEDGLSSDAYNKLGYKLELK